MRKELEDVWVEIDGVVAVGLTKSFVEDSGDITFIDFKKGVGDEVENGDVIATLETVKSVVELKSPLKGKIVELNEGLKDNPDPLNEDPDGTWVVKIEPAEGEIERLKEG